MTSIDDRGKREKERIIGGKWGKERKKNEKNDGNRGH